MHTRVWRMVVVMVLLGAVVAPAPAAQYPPARRARLQSHLSLPTAHSVLLQQDSTFACFEGQLSVLLNPACFQTDAPPRPGDCVSVASDFFVQYLFIDVPTTQKILGFGFLSNDDATVFPSAGVLQLPIDNQGNVRYPTPTELANLQVQQVETIGDTSVVFVDVEAANIVVAPGGSTAIVVALQFPAGGDLTAVGVGPGIAADADHPDQTCDYFTIDGGTTWFIPAECSPSDPNCDPLDWGFVLLMEPAVPVRPISWSQVKSLYRTP